MKSITFGDKERRIEYNTRAACAIEDKAGKPLIQVVHSALNQQDIRSGRLLLWGGLIKHHPETTLEEAEELTDLHEDRLQLLADLYKEIEAAGFFGKAAKAPPKKRASAKSTAS